MADTDVLVSELDSASAINTNDLLLMTQPDGEAQTGYASRKGTVLQAATKMLKGIEFSTDLPHFDNKTVLGGLEELSTGKANTSGEYNGLISGQANALKPSARLENSTPYLFRPSFANGYGYETLIGGTCGVNQLVDSVTDYKNTLTDTRGYLQLRIMVNSEYIFNKSISTAENIVIIINSNFTSTSGFIIKHDGSQQDLVIYTSPSTDNIITGHKYLFKANVISTDTTTVNGLEIKDIQLIDLTQMFGSTIADYVYTLESGSSGAGVAWLKNTGFLGADYYPYNAGGLLSVKTSKKINTGKNYTDISDNTIASADYVIGGFPVAINADNVVLPVGDYVFSFIVQNATFPCACQLIWYRNGVEVGNTVESISESGINSIAFTASGEFDSFAMFCNSSSGGAFTNFNLNIGSTPSAYEPYVSHEYTLDDIELRGILKLDGNNNLYYDGDTYESNGSVSRKYGIVTFDGSNDEDWGFVSGNHRAYISVADIDTSTADNAVMNIISSAYIAGAYSGSGNRITGRYGIAQINVFDDSVSDISAWRTKLTNNPLVVVYELATPTTETADAFTNPMQVDGNGTEEFVDGRTVEMPVGHETIYVDDNDATKLDNLPDISNDGNGTYLVNQANGQMSLVKYGIPNPPTTDGSYRLEVTVTDGVPAYTWEVIS